MMNNVVLDDAVEEMASSEAKVSVHGGQSALDEGPGLGIVVGDLHVGVVQIGDGNCSAARLAN